MDVVVLRYSMELRSPGCIHFVLESVSADPPFLLENRSDHLLEYRQANVEGLPFTKLPPYSAAGFLWQVPGRTEPNPERAEGILGAQQSDAALHQVHLQPAFFNLIWIGPKGGSNLLRVYLGMLTAGKQKKGLHPTSAILSDIH